MKKVIRLTESQLKGLIAKVVIEQKEGAQRIKPEDSVVDFVKSLTKGDTEIGGQSSVEDDDYDERIERNYGVEDDDKNDYEDDEM